ncbi:MAG: DUF2806 domain-containing protein [Clostridia bacterium]|nr:DUF2806 domain-containing protein [Clostridia bacterium]
MLRRPRHLCIRSSSSTISNDKIKKIWASILAREIEQPNHISISLLHSLSMFGKTQAISFCNISRFALQDYQNYEPHAFIYVTTNRVQYANSEISPSSLKEMERLGLIECNFENEYVFLNKKVFTIGNKIINVYGNPENDNKIKVGNVTFTNDGKILYSIIDDQYKRYSPEILDFIIIKLIKRGCKVTINK